MDTCTADYERLARGLGGLRCDGNPLITLTNPFGLQHWSMPVIEALLVVGAVACLIHALRWRREHGDSSNLVVWIASIFVLLMVEPIAYFPQWFGLERSLGLTFVHNQFSVQFLYDRLPLYIVAMYPVYTYISYVLIQRTGIFKRHNVIVGATCVAFTFHCLYEVVDTVGVQFRWWVWNEELSTSVPALGVVPYLNIQAFSLGVPFGIALLTLLVSKRPAPSGWRVARNVLVVCLFTWPVMFLSSLPATLLNLVGVPIISARLVGTWLLIAAAAALSAVVLAREYAARRSDSSRVPAGVERDYFALVCVVVYLVACVAFWGAALPDYLRADHGITPSGAPTGSLAYGVVTFVLSVALTAACYLATTSRARQGALATVAAYDDPAP
ncbi:hypothetical protein ACQI5H_08230 [Mycobacterium heidelbergense]|uniref:hypothetical protein n=1 Tax=Mycobacterium heidelbergense TaxID=53376 RepID=UPI003CF56E31